MSTPNARALLNPRAAEHIVKLLGMLGSDHAGERAAAGLKAHQFITQLGLTWRDVVAIPAADWQAMAWTCRKHVHLLRPHERDFVGNIAQLRRQPTDRQLAWLEDIYKRVQQRETAA
jgi:hypothetical protein